jgi:alcohol dehydrogenase
VLGGAAGVPHGLANSIILPHALRFNLDSTAEALAQAAVALGAASPAQAERAPAGAAEALVAHVAVLIAGMGLPTRLREAGVQREDLPRLASLALQSRAVQSNPKPASTAEQVLGIFETAW